MNRRVVTALMAAGLLLTSGCGGDDAFPRDEFVKQVTGERGGVTEPVANCTYEGIKDDQEIMDDLKRADGPNDNITAKTDEKMSRIIARCLLGAEPGATDGTDSDSSTSTTSTTSTTEP